MSNTRSNTLYGLKTCSEMCDERFASIYLKSKGLCLKDEGVGARLSPYIQAFLLGARGAYYSHMFAHANARFTPSLWTCGKKKDGGRGGRGDGGTGLWGGCSRVLPGSRPSVN